MGNFDDAVLNAWLDAMARNTSYGLNTQVWVKVHTGDPGGAGTTNPAGNTTRQQATFGAAASAGAIANTVAVEWTNVNTTETYTHVSLWSLSAAGTFLGNDQLSSSAAVAVGDTFRIPIGDLDLTLTSGI
jgi:hypothetical protein